MGVSLSIVSNEHKRSLTHIRITAKHLDTTDVKGLNTCTYIIILKKDH